jgi:hypothetical protein
VRDADFALARMEPAFDLVEQWRNNPLPRLRVEAARKLAGMDEEEAVLCVELLELLDAGLEAVVEREVEVLRPLVSSSINSPRPSHSSGA